MNVLLSIESMIYLKHKSNKGPASHTPFGSSRQMNKLQHTSSLVQKINQNYMTPKDSKHRHHLPFENLYLNILNSLCPKMHCWPSGSGAVDGNGKVHDS